MYNLIHKFLNVQFKCVIFTWSAMPCVRPPIQKAGTKKESLKMLKYKVFSYLSQSLFQLVMVFLFAI